MSTFEYAPAPESRSVVDIRSSYGLFVNGEFTDPAGGHSFKTVSPSTEEVLAEVAEAGAEDVDRAVKAARRAHTKVWSTMPGRERSGSTSSPWATPASSPGSRGSSRPASR